MSINRNPPASLLRQRLLVRFGEVCTAAGCGSRHRLEFAHIAHTGLNGRGRGSRNRYYDILRHPECYRLLCRTHHRALDGPWGSYPPPGAPEDAPPF